VKTAVERRQASAPASGGRRKPPFSVARTARRLRAGSTTLRLPAFRFLLFFVVVVVVIVVIARSGSDEAIQIVS